MAKNFFDDLNRQRYKKIQPWVANKKVLDIGAVGHKPAGSLRPGRLHHLLRQDAAQVVGIDILKNEVKKLRVEGYDVRVANAENFDLKEKFDVVFAGELLEHLSNFTGFFNSILKHLRRSGILIITTPNSFGFYYFLSNLIKGRFVGNPEHICWFDLFTLRQLLKRFGFEIIETDYFEMLYPSKKAILNHYPFLRRLWMCFSKFFPKRFKNTILVVASPRKEK